MENINYADVCAKEVLRYVNWSKDSADGRELIKIIKYNFDKQADQQDNQKSSDAIKEKFTKWMSEQQSIPAEIGEAINRDFLSLV